MIDILRQPATGPSLWRGDQFISDRSWIHELSRADILDLEDGLANVKRIGVTPGEFSKQDFPLTTFGEKIACLLQEVQDLSLIHISEPTRPY